MENWLDRQQSSLPPGVAPYYQEPLVIERGEGRYVQDAQGRRYLDFFGGILTVSIGHAHPAVTRAVTDQLGKMVHTSTLYISPPMVQMAERLSQWTPPDLNVSFFTTSGTEANETAITMAQLATGRQEIIALRHSYSGRSHLAMGLTGQAPWKLGAGGLGVPVRHAHNAYCYRCPFGKRPDTCALECAKDFEEFIKTSTSGDPAAYIAEPIQGVGGFITPPAAFLYETVQTARRYGALFIDDEVQTGFGRTGKAFGIDHSGVVPDFMTFAKGLANGLPIGATITRRDIGKHYRGPTISTFGGNPLSMRAALATLEVMEQENLVEHSKTMGQRLRDGLEDLSDRFPVMGDVRGRGLMQAVEFVRHDKEPAPDLALEFLEACRRQSLLVGKGGLLNNTIRIAPPMTVTESEMVEALAAMRAALDEMMAAHPELQDVLPTRLTIPQ